jgi:hypothetical protein
LLFKLNLFLPDEDTADRKTTHVFYWAFNPNSFTSSSSDIVCSIFHEWTFAFSLTLQLPVLYKFWLITKVETGIERWSKYIPCTFLHQVWSTSAMVEKERNWLETKNWRWFRRYGWNVKVTNVSAFFVNKYLHSRCILMWKHHEESNI